MGQGDCAVIKPFSVVKNITEQEVAELLCAGMEGGIGYWAKIVDYDKPPRFFYTLDGFKEDGTPKHVYKHIDYALNPGGAVYIEEEECDDPVPLKIDREALQGGLEVMAEKYPKHFADFVEGNEDATTGDVFIQCCVFGRIVYG
jgi:hypothetical protein